MTDNSRSHVIYENALTKAKLIVAKLEEVTREYEQLLIRDNISLSNRVELLNVSPFELAYSKMNSRLINIAVCGAFSSGKSFLISGLIGRLDWYQREKAGFFSEHFEDGYSSFLPSSPEQTSSCPLVVSPNEENSHSRLEVLFADSPKWENKTEPYISEDDVKRKMLTYVTDIEEWNDARPRKDLPRRVVRAKLLVANMPLPAAIHDLPGIGGAGEEYLETVHEAIRQADCVIYVASAIRELSETELDLLRFMEGVAKVSQIPVFFALSQIDREPEWQKIRNKNNKFLAQYFLKDGSANKAFIGNGFFPVSPAVQAKANGLFASNKISETDKNRAIRESGMPEFFNLLYEHLTSTSGPAHLQEIIIQMRGLLTAVDSHVRGQLFTETIPIEQTEKRIEEHKRLGQAFLTKRNLLMKELEALKDSTIREAFATSDSDELLRRLRVNIEPLIKESDVLKDSVRHRIQQKRDEITESWLRRPSGLEASWDEAWAHYQKQTILFLYEHISEAVKEASVSSKNLIDSMRDGEKVEGGEGISPADTLKLVNDSWDLVVGVAGLGGGMAATIAAMGGIATALGPFGFFLMFAGAVGLGFGAWKRYHERKQLREELMRGLPAYADGVVEEGKSQAKQILVSYEGEISKIVSRLISEQDEKRHVLEQRLRSGDLKENQVKIRLLKDYHEQLTSVQSSIDEFFEYVGQRAD